MGIISYKVCGEAIFGLSFYAHDERIVTAMQCVVAEFEVQGSLSKSQRCVPRNARYTLKRQRLTAS